MKPRIHIDPLPTGLRSERVFARSPGRLAARTASNRTEILIAGEIGFDGLTESAFKGQLAAANGPVTLQINSPGGDATAGIAIYNLAVAHRHPVRVEVLGLAASAASIIAMAGDEIAMARNAHLMIHKAWGLTVGNTDAHHEQAALLAKIDTALAKTYVAQSLKSESQILALMDAETWLDADEAVEIGLATEIMDTDAQRSQFDLAAYRNAPVALKTTPASPAHFDTAGDLERALHQQLSLSRAAAKAVARAGFAALTQSNPEFAHLSASLSDAIAELRRPKGN